jgi:hypothetical protein
MKLDNVSEELTIVRQMIWERWKTTYDFENCPLAALIIKHARMTKRSRKRRLNTTNDLLVPFLYDRNGIVGKHKNTAVLIMYRTMNGGGFDYWIYNDTS